MKRRIVSVFLCMLMLMTLLSETALALHDAAAMSHEMSTQEPGTGGVDDSQPENSNGNPQPSDGEYTGDSDIPPEDAVVPSEPIEQEVVPVIVVSPSTISAGTSNPSLTVSSTVPFGEWAEKCVSLETGETGLTLSSITVDYGNGNGGTLTLSFQGVAHEGYIRGYIDREAFLAENATGAEFSIQVEPSRYEAETCMVLFIANNGEEKNGIAEVEKGQAYALPDYTFNLPTGKEFVGWNINREVYSPGDMYIFHEDTAVLAILQDVKPKLDEKQEKINNVIHLIEEYIKEMMPEEREDPDCIDLATLYAETVSENAVRKTISGSTVTVSATSISELVSFADSVYSAANDTLEKGGVQPARELMKTVALDCTSDDIKVSIKKDILSSSVDKISVKTPSFGMTFKVSDLAPDLGSEMTVEAKNSGTKAAPKIEISLPNKQTTNSIVLSLPSEGANSVKHVIQDSEGTTAVSKRNPFKNTIEGKVNSSGTYGRVESEKDFSDIGKKSQEMQTAIRYLASMGIISGTSPTTFSPDASISRAEIAKLLVSALGKLDPRATSNFSDVTKKNWYYSVAASSQKHGLVKGYEDNTFRGTEDISKVQIVALSSRVLISEMKYQAPQATSKYLSKYSDSIPQWAQSEVALATKENIVVLRSDGTFGGDKSMTRGDAAIIIYRLFQRIW